MRIIRLKIKPDVAELLFENVTNEFGIKDKGFVEDVFAMLRLSGGGLPSPKRIELMAEYASKKLKMSKILAKLAISKRKVTLAKLASVPYFHALCKIYKPIEATSRLISHFRTLYFKARQSQCISCHLFANCDFGQQYGVVMTDIRLVIDPDFSKKVHDDCPLKPEIDITNQLAAAVTVMQDLLDKEKEAELDLMDKNGADTEDLKELASLPCPDVPEDDEKGGFDPDDGAVSLGSMPTAGHARSNVYDGKHDGSHICKVTEDFINRVTAQQLGLFEIGRKIGVGLASTKKGNFKPVPQIEHDSEENRIKKISDVKNITTSQHMLPDEIFNAKLANKELIKKDYIKPHAKKQLLYLLSDNSGSMCGQLPCNPNHLVTRGSLSTLLSVSLARRVRDDGGIMFVRFFSGSVGPLHCARNVMEYEHVLALISGASYIAGATNIVCAIKNAVEDIKTQGGDIAKAEIILVSDNEDDFSVDDARAALEGYELNVLDVSGGSARRGASAQLKAIAKSYYKANESFVNIQKIVELI